MTDFGMSKQRSCCDQIATLRIIVEQTLEWNTVLYLVFVDFEKTSDSLDQEVLWMILWHYAIPEKIVRMIRVFYGDFQARVLHDGDMTEPFSMSTQPPFLPVALDWVSRQALGDNEAGIQLTLLRKLEDLDFADDIVLLSQKITHMRQKFEALQEQAARVGLKVNAAKTKVPGKRGYHQLCRRQPGAGNSLHIPWKPYHHHWRHRGRRLRPDAGRHKLLSPF